MKSLIRKLKINDIEPLDFTENEIEIVNFINSNISNLTEFKVNEKSISIFYMNSKGEYIFEFNEKTNLRCRYFDFWEVLEKKYKLKYRDIQLLIKYMIEKSLNIKVSIPISQDSWFYDRIEKSFKDRV